MRTYDAIARAVFSRPWAILPATLKTIVEVVTARIAGERFEDEEIAARVAAAQVSAGPRSGAQRSGAVAIIPLYGLIVPRAGLMSQMSGGTSVEQFRNNFREALGDDRVGAILIDCDSPGGAVDAVPEMADEVRAARGQKPIVAVANTLMASAAYWICSAAQEVWASPSSQVGSIGVLAAHEDVSKADEMAGVKTTLISAGKFKTEGNPYEPLTDEARAAIQDDVDQFYAMFTGAVAKSRGVPIDTVREGYGQGRVLGAKDAKAAGMIESIGTFDQALVQASRLGAGTPPRSGALAWSLVSLPLENGNLAVTVDDVVTTTLDSDDGAGAGSAASDDDHTGAVELEFERARAEADAARRKTA